MDRVARRRGLGLAAAAIVAAGALLAGAFAGGAVSAQEDIGVEVADVEVVVNGKPLVFDVFPRIVRGRLMVPWRAVATALGAEPEWNEVERRITAKRGWLTVDIKVGDPRASLNSELAPVMDVPPFIAPGDRCLVPLRFVSESLGAKVDWDEATRTAVITMPDDDDAEKALAHPNAVISDAPGDYRAAPEGAPQGGTYFFPAIDLARVTVASDRESLYIKVLLNGVIPTSPVTAEGFNQVNGMKIRIALDTDRNTETGVVADRGAEALITYNVNLQAGRETASFYSGLAGGVESTGATGTAFGNAAEVKYARQKIGRIVDGGMGSSYVTMAFYLQDLGIQRGSEFDLYATAAASTPNWSAFSFDEAPNEDQKPAYTVRIPDVY
ncbi:MAG: copper amine oxidase N-terminal domain-containing protein [Firmicutes bacterium]|jgi:hypothetical protein|nr:copper amine oxidase N-terminal domain-containing protein [Bacillota bacterium]